MILRREKRKLEFEEKTYYWSVKKGRGGIPKIHICASNKALFLLFGFDYELAVSPQVVKDLIATYFKDGAGSHG